MIQAETTANPSTPAMQRLSRRLGRLSDMSETRVVTLDDLLAAFGRAGFGLVILVMSLPPLIPIPGPFGFIFGTALSIVAIQMLIGRDRLWFPRWLGRRNIPAALIKAMPQYAARVLSPAGTWLQPRRMRHFNGRAGQRLTAIPVLILAIIIALPIPFANVAPALALIVLALSLIERDGLVQMIAIGLGVVAIGVTILLASAAGQGIAWAMA